MATNQGLNIQLSGDASEFIAELKKAVSQAEAANSGLASASASTDALAAAMNKAQAASKALSTALKENQQSLGGTETETVQAARGFGILTKSFADTVKYENAFISAAKSGNLALGAQADAAQRLGKAIDSNVSDPIKKAGSATNKAGQIATNFGRILSDLPFGFIAIQNNIDPLVASLGLGAGLGLAFTLAGAAATTMVQKYGSLSNAYDALFANLSAAEQAQKSLNKARDEGNANADTELVHLQGLYTATQNLNIPLKQRNKIVDELQKQYPAYFGNLSNEAILAGNATSAYNKLRDSIIAVAQSKAIEEELVAQSKATRKLQGDYKDATRSALEYENKAADLRQELQKQFQLIKDNPNSLAGGQAPGKIANLQRQLIDIQAVIDGYTQKQIKNRDAQADAALVAKSLADEQQNLAAKFNEVTTGFDAAPKKVKTVADVLKQLQSEISAIDYQAKLTGASFDSISADKVNALQKAFDDLVKLGLSPTSPEIKKISDQINLLGAATIGNVPIMTKQIKDYSAALGGLKDHVNTIQEIQKLLGTKDTTSQLQLDQSKLVRPNLAVDSGTSLENIDKYQGQLNDRIAQVAIDTQAKINSTNIVWGNITGGLGAATVDIGNQLRGLAVAAASGLGEVIGGIISGGDSLGQSLYKLVGVVGQFIVDFGKSLIEAATLKIIAEKTLFANPYVALAAGIAAVALGSVLENKVPSFATGGGIIGGPQLSMIGDNPGREEYVIPSEVLDKIGGSGPRIVRVIGEIRGQDISLANARANRGRSRIN